MLSLPEKIFLLSIFEKRNSVQLPSSAFLPYILSGAGLMQMTLLGMARFDDNRFILVNETYPEDLEWFHPAVEKVSRSWKPKKLDHWVYLLGSKGKLIAQGIVPRFLKMGILLGDGKAYEWGMNKPMGSPEGFPSKYWLKCQLRDSVLWQGKADEQTIALLRFIEVSEMLDHIFTKDEIIAAKKQMKRFQKEESLNASFANLLDGFISATGNAVAAAVSR